MSIHLPMVRPGDRVALVSPASYPEQAGIDHLLETLDSWGLIGEVAPHALDRWGYMAGPDDVRLADLNDAFRRPEIRAVIATRGGAGAYRIADGIDTAAVLADPKPLIGFSDITYLHLSLWLRCGLPAIHGCLVGQTAEATVKQLLMSTEPLTLTRDPDAVSACVDAPGQASGRIIGGNLAMLATSVGARMPSLAGDIFFMEDQRVVGLGTIDRQLTQLISSGSLDGVSGILLGSFEAFRGYHDRGWTLADVLQDRLGGLGVPVLGGLYCGHDLVGLDGGPDQSALPLGTMASFDTETGVVIVDSPVG